MPKDLRRVLALLTATTFASGCGFVPQWQVRQSQLAAYRMYGQQQQMAGELANAQMLASSLEAEKQQLAQSLDVANQRLANLAAEREQLHGQYKHLLTTLPAPGNPLGGSAHGRFLELSRRYPEFEFDPETGVSRFNGNLLFDTGSDVINPSGLAVLREFASIMNSGDASQFNILVVGHTDDVNIVHASTRAKHPNNWYLSAHRAAAVIGELGKNGITEPRMGGAYYSKHQPSVPNNDDQTRQQNRRVEIFILAADAAIAGRDTLRR